MWASWRACWGLFAQYYILYVIRLCFIVYAVRHRSHIGWFLILIVETYFVRCVSTLFSTSRSPLFRRFAVTRNALQTCSLFSLSLDRYLILSSSPPPSPVHTECFDDDQLAYVFRSIGRRLAVFRNPNRWTWRSEFPTRVWTHDAMRPVNRLFHPLVTVRAKFSSMSEYSVNPLCHCTLLYFATSVLFSQFHPVYIMFRALVVRFTYNYYNFCLDRFS